MVLHISMRGLSRASKMDCFTIVVNGWKLLTNVVKFSLTGRYLDTATKATIKKIEKLYDNFS